MNVPLNWLSEYVTLPKNTKELTDKLTMVGHMLDKIIKRGDETIIDLELRGNRADMFGLIGVARDVSAILNTSLKLPEIKPLPKKDSNHNLIMVEKAATNLITRFEAIKMKVKIEPSPKWLRDRIESYGIPSINNVVDVTNFVMLETGIPMHAFDAHKVSGKINLRLAKRNESFQTIQQGLTVKLSDQDLIIGDALTMIGGFNSKVTNDTTEIILEAAVYNPGSVRRSARRLKISTEAGMRLEKHLDPEMVETALARAVDLINGKVIGLVSDFYPHPVKAKVIKFDENEILRLSGMTVQGWQRILSNLGFEVHGGVTVPTFRTDIEGPADLVEEIVRIYGYDKIPETPLTDATPIPMTYPTFALSEKLRDILIGIGLNEVITLTMVSSGEIALINPPDPDLKWLRASIYPSLIEYSKKRGINVFEIGNTFSGNTTKYHEHTHLSLVVSDNLTGFIQKLENSLGSACLPWFYGKTENLFWAEIDVQDIRSKFVNSYEVVSQYPAIIEDMNINYDGNYAKLIKKIKKISNLIKQIDLIDEYENKLTLRITYHDAKRQLSNLDVAPIRAKLDNLGSLQ